MYVVYYDEVKFEKGVQPANWFGGIAVHVDQIDEIEGNLNSLAKDIFGHSVLNLETEFYAKDIFHGKKNFKGMSFDDRLAILEKLISYTAVEAISSIYARVEIEKVRFISSPAEGEELTFMYFIEKADEFLKLTCSPEKSSI